MMHSYRHVGVARDNGLVDPSQEEQAAVLQLQPEDDALHLPSFEPGHFEWWYFDVLDARQGYVLKLIAHLGTDPLRQRCALKVVVTVRTPDHKKVLVTPFLLEDLHASRTSCDVTIGKAWQSRVVSSTEPLTYDLAVSLPGFHASLQFRGQIEGWKPLGDALPMHQGSKHAAFSWIVPLPCAEVSGEFVLKGVPYTFKNALGYHDHNVWQVAPHARLFLDEVVAHWQWGRFLADDCAIVFMETCFHTHALQSCLVVRDGTIVHSSNNRVTVVTEQVTQDEVLHVPYPTRLTVTLAEDPGAFALTLQARDVLERQDLLAGVPALKQWLIKQLLARPTYHGLQADATLQMADGDRQGQALYESAYFRRGRKTNADSRRGRSPQA